MNEKESQIRTHWLSRKVLSELYRCTPCNFHSFVVLPVCFFDSLMIELQDQIPDNCSSVWSYLSNLKQFQATYSRRYHCSVIKASVIKFMRKKLQTKRAENLPINSNSWIFDSSWVFPIFSEHFMNFLRNSFHHFSAFSNLFGFQEKTFCFPIFYRSRIFQALSCSLCVIFRDVFLCDFHWKDLCLLGVWRSNRLNLSAKRKSTWRQAKRAVLILELFYRW